MSEAVQIPLLTGLTAAGEPILLRQHTLADREGVLERCLDPTSLAWTQIPYDYTPAMALDYIRRMAPHPGEISWAVELDGRYAGSIDLRLVSAGDPTCGNIGFVAAGWARGRGVIRAATVLVLAHALDVRGLERVIWQARVGNEASARVAWQAGFTAPRTVPGLLHERGTDFDGWQARIGAADQRRALLTWPQWRRALLVINR